jgi:hypothetical protein
MTKADREAARERRKQRKLANAFHAHASDAYVAAVRAYIADATGADDWLAVTLPNGKPLRDCTFGELQAIHDQHEAEADAGADEAERLFNVIQEGRSDVG